LKEFKNGEKIMGKKALCVGINNFKNYPGSSLNGCINDAYDMEGILVQYMGFEERDVVKLVDKEATKSNIMKNLQEMVGGAMSGEYDRLIFSMSSHGTQMPDVSGDEPDDFDEAFCPYDLDVRGDEWDPDRIILDDELHDLFTQLPEDVSLEVYLDTCHSGTGLRAMEPLHDREPRYIPPPSGEVFQKVGSREFRHPPLLGNHILWAACRSDQTSADAFISEEWHGAFTYYFCREIKISENKLSRDEVLKNVARELDANGYSQIPQLECDATTRAKKCNEF